MASAALLQSCSSLRTPFLLKNSQKSLSADIRPRLIPRETVRSNHPGELLVEGLARAERDLPCRLVRGSRSSVRCAAAGEGEKPSSFAKQWSRTGGSSSSSSSESAISGAARRIAEKGGRGESRPSGGKNKRGGGKPARGRASGDAQQAGENGDGAGAEGEAREGGGSGRRERQKRSHVVLEPAEFPEPMSRDPHVAILGGGMAGLMCALGLAERGIRSTVFDTGKHGLGGRMATREVEVAGKLHLFDHAAQFFTVTDSHFQSYVNRWLKEDALRVWEEGRIGTLQAGGAFSELPTPGGGGSNGGEEARRLISPRGMRAFCEHVIADKVREGVVGVERPVWIGKMRARGGKWVVEETGRKAGEFDFVGVFVLQCMLLCYALVSGSDPPCDTRKGEPRAHRDPRLTRAMELMGLSHDPRLMGLSHDPRLMGLSHDPRLMGLSHDPHLMGLSHDLPPPRNPLFTTSPLLLIARPLSSLPLIIFPLIALPLIASHLFCCSFQETPSGHPSSHSRPPTSSPPSDIFQPPPLFTTLQRLELSSIWASLIAFETPLLANGSAPRGHFDAAFVEGVPAVAWMCNNTAKLGEKAGAGRGDGGEGSGAVRRGEAGVECWTVFSSAAYGKRNKVPQENIPLARAARVKEEMLEGVAVALGRPKDSLPAVLFHKIQLWGAALPLNAPTTAAGGGVECIMDASTRVGLCGDWLLAPSIQAAAVSGLAMADKIAAFHEDAAVSDPLLFSVGLDASFAAVPEAHDIGAFPDATPDAAESNGRTRDIDAAQGAQVAS
ncbi:unnamed protein product [Closterium sp. Naga37s-1]|nr:unnamed protein product [Closterium sp. Naga37s-1]